MGHSRWITGGLGWLFFGPIGGLLGFALGSLFDASADKSNSIRNTNEKGFTASLLVLIAIVMKADGRILKSELSLVKTFLVENYGPGRTKDMLAILRNLLDKDIAVSEVTEQIKLNLNYSSRLELLHFLFRLATADNDLDAREIEILKEIAFGIGLNTADYQSIAAMFQMETSETLYKILEISPDASDAEIKKAYRRMAMKYHPGKVNYLDEKMKQSAEEKFKRVNEAYKKIKKIRNIK